VTSIERTAYPQFRRLTSARVLHVFFTPSDDEVEWARDRSESAESLLVALKCFQKMARFCPQPAVSLAGWLRHPTGARYARERRLTRHIFPTVSWPQAQPVLPVKVS
jgi:hypothetical protein